MKELEINADKPYLKLNEKELEEIESLRQELEAQEIKNADPTIPIKDKELKERIVRLCAKISARTKEDKKHIRKTCFVISGAFSWHKYGDKLDDAIQIAKELEIKESHKKVDVFELFRLMQDILDDYLEDIEKNKKQHKKLIL